MVQASSDNDMTSSIIVLVVLGFVVLIIVLTIRQAQARKRALREGKQNYLDSLEKLKHSPTNANLRQRTLELGRYYSNLTRNQQGVTIFDEVALSNDIGAACAGAAASTPQTSGVASTKSSVEERLTKLLELKSKGLINEQEYESKRARILDEV